MKVSVIIPTYNEEKVIGECLKSLSVQTQKDTEVIVVDDGSTDDTKRVVGDVKFLEQEHKGAGEARNLGAKHAKGDILVFIDADMTFDKDFLKKLTEPIMEGKVKGTFSKEEYVSNWENVWARCWNINEGWEKERRHPKNYPDRQKVFRAVLKSEFERVGGFDPKKGYMDDWSLGQKLKYDAVNAPGAVFYHQNPDNLTDIFVQAKWVAKRPYKLGGAGKIYALLRASLPESLWEGFWKSLFNKEPLFIVFKVVYDLGIFAGILENLILGKTSK
jgi:glycosyltransferase involved in cell wall biosynthesis